MIDLENLARELFLEGKKEQIILTELQKYVSLKKAKAILQEIKNSEKIEDEFVRQISSFPKTINAEESGLGCRGEGDFLIHKNIAKIIGKTNAVIDSFEQDDAGVINLGKKFIVVSVDGMHSRLSHFPFLAGFHVARASLRDVIVKGAIPICLFSDVHLANNGSISKVFDYNSGITAVSELTNVPLITGSTLRIGGDLVLGDRLVGLCGAVGIAKKIFPRRNLKEGDVILLTEGRGGGTITTIAIFNGKSEIVKETLNIDFIDIGIRLLKSKFLNKIHVMIDITNGGIRGDAYELSKIANVKILLNEKELQKSVNQNVLKMLNELKIDYRGISTDSLLIALPEKNAEELLNFIRKNNVNVCIAGRVEKGEGVYLDGKKLFPNFRESAYTPIKKVVGEKTPKNFEEIKREVEKSFKEVVEKKEKVKRFVFGVYS